MEVFAEVLKLIGRFKGGGRVSKELDKRTEAWASILNLVRFRPKNAAEFAEREKGLRTQKEVYLRLTRDYWDALVLFSIAKNASPGAVEFLRVCKERELAEIGKEFRKLK